MAECNPQELLLEASCFTCLPADQQYLVRLALLCRILNGVTLPCDVNTLLEEAKCFACLPPGMWPILELQLLCEISQGGGGGEVNCDPTAASMEHQGGSQVIPAGVNTQVEFDTLIFETQAGMVDLVNDWILIPSTGVWQINGRVTWGDDSGNKYQITMFIRRNGLPIAETDFTFDTTIAATCTQESAQLINLVAGDKITLAVNQGSGVDVSLIGSEPARVVLSASKVVGCAASA